VFVHNLQKTGRRTLVLWYGFIQTILKAEVNVGLSNIEIRNSPSEWVEFFYAYASWIVQALILMLSKTFQFINNNTNLRPRKTLPLNPIKIIGWILYALKSHPIKIMVCILNGMYLFGFQRIEFRRNCVVNKLEKENLMRLSL